MPNTEPPQERPTDPSDLRPDASDESLVSVVIPKDGAVPAGMLQANPNSWADQQMGALLEALRESKESRADKDVLSRMLSAQTETISKKIDANQRIVLSGLQSLRQSVDAVTTRVAQVETQVDLVETQQESSADRFERFELDMAAFREQVEQRFNIMLGEIDVIKRAANQ